MAEYRLSYTASDINKKLGKIDEIEDDIHSLDQAVMTASIEVDEAGIQNGFVDGRPERYGVISITELWRCTDFIPLIFDKGQPVHFVCTIYVNGGIGFYDENKTCLLAIRGEDAASYGLVANRLMEHFTIVPPEGAVYVRLSRFVQSDEVHTDFKIWGPKTVNLNDAINSKLDVYQGEWYTGQMLIIGEDGIARPGFLNTDATLKNANQPADAKAVGDALIKKADSSALTKGLSGKANSNHTHAADTLNSFYEANLYWGGKGISGALSPIDTAASMTHSAPRLAFAKPAGITVEYSRDAGATWVDYEATDEQKIGLVSDITQFLYVGKKTDQANVTVDDKLRVTFDFSAMGVYAVIRKLLISVSTNGANGTYVLIEKSLKSSVDTFTEIGNFTVSGWSGWNSCPASYGACGGGEHQTSNTHKVRLTFGMTGLSTSSNNAFHLRNIIAIGENAWTFPSEMSRGGHLYFYDVNQNATFPAKITARGGFDGTATRATADASGNNIVNTYETKADANAKMSRVMTLPENGSTGTLGQFAVSDGEGGIMWFSVLDGEEAEF